MNIRIKYLFLLLTASILFFGCFGKSDSDYLTVHMIDVGQGDSFLIKTPEGTSILIDGGSPQYGDDVVAYLKREKIQQIDYLIATHPHSDHIGGLVTVMNEFPVENLILPEVSHTSQLFESFLDTAFTTNVPLFPVKKSSRHSLEDEIFFDILHTGVHYGSHLNNWSVVLRLTHQEMSFLFTGDLESEAERDLLNQFSSKKLASEVLKVGHHGSNTSTTPAFLQVVSPQVALISCGINNQYGHPSTEVVNRLEESGVWIYRTDLQGTIVLYSDGYNVWSHQPPVNLDPISSSNVKPSFCGFFVNGVPLLTAHIIPFKKEVV
ncbi:ComEC/Rec2 family competence protein [Tindallia californiensis]|uniref:Competence protein ComEC n=1 Tax=Tindallia californiensis TaxID=159292 RepID=A0A1H3IV29_9FIRM|nr:ComEC/Rec2 family competence protein [Tindallia californiensis]SDY31551.1 competence protein ComEC [Tindallia californiensis]